MKFLVLEDTYWRQQIFREALSDCKIVATMEQCVKALRSEAWDVVYLDFDLGKGVESGIDLVLWACSNDVNVGKFVCHSACEFAGRWMAKELTGAGYKAGAKPMYKIINEWWGSVRP